MFINKPDGISIPVKLAVRYTYSSKDVTAQIFLYVQVSGTVEIHHKGSTKVSEEASGMLHGF